jgi:hypothetical protein
MDMMQNDSPMKEKSSHALRHSYEWVTREENKRKAGAFYLRAKRVFTEHPADTSETYLEHLWFTIRMSLRFNLVSILLLTHGVFPFLFTRTASAQIERIYLIMKARIPKSRRAIIDEWCI